jgi:flavin reductase (DIM6/NTAB) family NADH-FMN oxidoreductase RutF
MSELTKPRQIILISSKAEIDVFGKQILKENLTAIDQHMPCSNNPKLYAINLSKISFSYRLIKKSNVFIVNFVSNNLAEEAKICLTRHGDHTDKFKETNLTKVEGETVDCPSVKEALGYLECEVVEEIETGDHITFIGKILREFLKEDDKRLFHLGDHQFSTTL